MEVGSNLPLESEINWDEYREPNETEGNWAVRREFLEKNHGKRNNFLLGLLSKVFINTQIYGARYPRKTMEEVRKLGVGISTETYEKNPNLVVKGTNPPRRWPPFNKYKRARDSFDKKYFQYASPVACKKREVWRELPEDEELVITNFQGKEGQISSIQGRSEGTYENFEMFLKIILGLMGLSVMLAVILMICNLF